MPTVHHAKTPILDIAYEDSGDPGHPGVVLLHGYPYDVRSFDAVVPVLVAAGRRVIVPYLRGYGPTCFRSPSTPRSGEQAALGQDVRALLDALGIPTATLAGFDWGARAACVVAALWPARVTALVTCAGYLIQDNSQGRVPLAPAQEARFWYQHYFHTARGRIALTENRGAIEKLLWKLWSPTWTFDDATFAATAASFDNPDFVDVVVHAYCHRTGSLPGDPHYAALEAALQRQPTIAAPTIVVHGEVDGVLPADQSEAHQRHFTGRYERRVLPGIGHNPPQEAPAAFAAAILALG